MNQEPDRGTFGGGRVTIIAQGGQEKEDSTADRETDGRGRYRGGGRTDNGKSGTDAPLSSNYTPLRECFSP